jgi:hypothetical protein
VGEVHGDDARRRRDRSAGTSVAVFTADVVAALGADGGLEPDDLDHRLRRPANLEDVFVSLTGELLT